MFLIFTHVILMIFTFLLPWIGCSKKAKPNIGESSRPQTQVKFAVLTPEKSSGVPPTIMTTETKTVAPSETNKLTKSMQENIEAELKAALEAEKKAAEKAKKKSELKNDAMVTRATPVTMANGLPPISLAKPMSLGITKIDNMKKENSKEKIKPNEKAKKNDSKDEKKKEEPKKKEKKAKKDDKKKESPKVGAQTLVLPPGKKPTPVPVDDGRSKYVGNQTMLVSAYIKPMKK